MSDFTIKAGSYCPVCRGIVLADCPHTIQQLDERNYRRPPQAASSALPEDDEKLIERIWTLRRTANEPHPEPQEYDGGWNNDGAIAQRVQAMRHNSWLDRIMLARKQLAEIAPEAATRIETLSREIERVKDAMRDCEGIESGPNGSGGMRVVAHFPVGKEPKLFSLLCSLTTGSGAGEGDQ